jgi:potassium-transporting ATPase KdpC subunit
MSNLIRPACVLFLLLSAVMGVLYPYAVFGVGQTVFATQANGSLIRQNGTVVGSALIGQSFAGPAVFWSRPSATGPMPNNPQASGGSNLGPRNPALADTVKARIEVVRAAHPEQTGPVPLDLVTASASGLDPHISPAAARYQASRVAEARNLPVEQVQRMIDAHTESPSLMLLGDARVNVLALNFALQARAPLRPQ